MGGQQSKSPRTVSFENDGPDGIIDISQNVVDRLKNQTKGRDDRQDDAPPRAKSEASGGSAAPPVAPVIPSSSPAPPRGGRRPAFLHYAEPSLTAMQVRHEKEAELRANDEYWRNRLQQTEVNLKKTNAVMEKEYQETVESVKALFQNAPITYQPAPCQEFRSRLIACYKAFPNETLNCAQEVRDFTTCVDKNRVQLLDAKHAPSK